MARTTREAAGTWLEGPAFQRSGPRGASLGLPADGPGSLATPGIRIAAFVIDAVIANLLAGLPYLFGVRYGPGERGYVVYAAFLIAEFVLVSLVGASIGKQACRVQVVRVDGGRLAWYWVLARTLLLGFFVPAIIWGRDDRGLHDKAVGAITVRSGTASATRTVGRPAAPAASSGVSTKSKRVSTPRPSDGAVRRPVKASAKRRKKRR